MCHLTQKYNVPSPRYTSYPTVPYWDIENFSGKRWKETVIQAHNEHKEKGISIYIHLPFCESMCSFCGCHKRITKRHEVELPYIRALLKEWRLYRQLMGSRPKIKEVHLGGGTPTFFSPENLQFLMEGIFRFADLKEDADFSFEGHPNNTTRAHLQVLYNLGFRKVCFGVQDYNSKVQQAIHRIQPFENVKRATETAREIGYTSVGHDIIYGLPFQTVSDVENTIDKTATLRPDRIAFYSYAHVPWRKGNGQRGYNNKDLPSVEEKLLQSETGRKALSDVGYQHIGMDHFALPTDPLFKAMEDRQLHRNFMGYTASKTHLLIGLGASSIGDSGYGLAQNVKGIEEYQHLVDSEVLPVFRGHILNQQDQIVRDQIRNLMCDFETEWQYQEAPQIDVQNVLGRLKTLEEDGLVQLVQNGIKITGKGKPFVRNVSMAFDLKLHDKQPDTQLFSMSV